ncbi:alkaline phosphatase family protein [Haloferax sp. DFSO52]|uniref:alkaline phosphatase family protein n=1 Tax=Haloferax sp. DFSO52 TaxID=3388505 RepID=UPI003A8508FD
MKVCVVGLDGATWDLLDPWLDDLPTIRSFASVNRGELKSCLPPISVPAWKCYTTGMNPGDLGVFTFVEPDFDRESLNTVSSETFTHREVWDYLGDAGYRSAAINVPSTSPPRDIDGWMVSGPFSDDDDFARPKSFERTLREDGYTILPDYYLSRDTDDLDDGIDSVRGKFDAALELKDDVDFAHVTIYLTDTVQHSEWNSPASKAFWEDVDRELGRFLDELGDEWNVVLMSDHGFGKSEGIFYLNTWLQEEGYMNIEDTGVDFGDVAGLLNLDYGSTKRLLQRLRLMRLVKSTLPSSLLVRIARQMPGNRKLEGIQDKLDWDSDAIALAPLIYTKTDAIAEEIREKLLALEDDFGNKVLDDVYYGKELYPDAPVRVPDLIVDHTDYVISDVVQPGTMFNYDEEEWPEHKIAHHRRNGIISARGPDVGEFDFDDANLVDVVPTVLNGFGVGVPDEMRGQSLGFLGDAADESAGSVQRDTDRVIDHDSEVEQKLKDLGYL